MQPTTMLVFPISKANIMKVPRFLLQIDQMRAAGPLKLPVPPRRAQSKAEIRPHFQGPGALVKSDYIIASVPFRRKNYSALRQKTAVFPANSCYNKMKLFTFTQKRTGMTLTPCGSGPQRPPGRLPTGRCTKQTHLKIVCKF